MSGSTETPEHGRKRLLCVFSCRGERGLPLQVKGLFDVFCFFYIKSGLFTWLSADSEQAELQTLQGGVWRPLPNRYKQCSLCVCVETCCRYTRAECSIFVAFDTEKCLRVEFHSHTQTWRLLRQVKGRSHPADGLISEGGCVCCSKCRQMNQICKVPRSLVTFVWFSG